MSDNTANNKMNQETVSIKMRFGDEWRRFAMPRATTRWETLENKIASIINLPAGGFRVCYIDEVEDQVTVSTDLEIAELLQSQNQLRLEVIATTTTTTNNNTIIPADTTFAKNNEERRPLDDQEWIEKKLRQRAERRAAREARRQQPGFDEATETKEWIEEKLRRRAARHAASSGSSDEKDNRSLDDQAWIEQRLRQRAERRAARLARRQQPDFDEATETKEWIEEKLRRRAARHSRDEKDNRSLDDKAWIEERLRQRAERRAAREARRQQPDFDEATETKEWIEEKLRRRAAWQARRAEHANSSPAQEGGKCRGRCCHGWRRFAASETAQPVVTAETAPPAPLDPTSAALLKDVDAETKAWIEEKLVQRAARHARLQQCGFDKATETKEWIERKLLCRAARQANKHEEDNAHPHGCWERKFANMNISSDHEQRPHHHPHPPHHHAHHKYFFNPHHHTLNTTDADHQHHHHHHRRGGCLRGAFTAADEKSKNHEHFPRRFPHRDSEQVHEHHRRRDYHYHRSPEREKEQHHRRHHHHHQYQQPTLVLVMKLKEEK